MIKKSSGKTRVARPVLFSGIQPTGKLHLGNYLGALKNFVDLQESGRYDCYYCIVDLHSLTLDDFDPKQKYKQILELTADFLAAGLDPKKSVIFQQALIPAHSELAWILGTIAPIGELRRMTQFKEKSEKEKEGANSGLLTYPLLMAADIVLYDAKYVPVGEDQIQHLELARALARKFNSRFSGTFVEPQPLLTEIPRVMSLKNPAKKMSKSDPASCVFLDDSPAEVKAKVMRATTDSESVIKYDPVNKTGISNLLRIYSALAGRPLEQVERDFRGKQYSEFKSALAELIADHFADFRKRKKALLAKPSALSAILMSGSAKAGKIAAKKINLVKQRVGLTK